MATQLNVGGPLSNRYPKLLVYRAPSGTILIRLYLIGCLMGIADLIPGVSGGTIAFVCGIYEELLVSIKTLQFQSMRKIAWPFLLPIGLGILTAVFFVSKLLFYLLLNHPTPLFALFFGVILASALFCGKRAGLTRFSHWIVLLVGALIAYFVAGLSEGALFGFSFIGLCLAGMVAACAMLLPGISGSYLLQLFGIYPLLLTALSAPHASGSLKVLLAIGLGAAFGFVCFSRVVSWLITHLSSLTYATLLGFMLGGCRSVWPFHEKGGWPFILLGFSLVICLELSLKSQKV